MTGVYLAGNRLGQAAITGIGGAIVAEHGWQYLFAWAGAAGILWLVPWLAFHWRYERNPVSPEVAVTSAISTRELLGSMRDRSIAGIFLGFFAYDYVWLLFISWLPGYLMLERKFGADEMAAYVSLPYVLTSGVAILNGVLSDAVVRRGYNEIIVRKWFITVGLLLCCALIVPAGFVEDRQTAALMFAASILSLSIAAPNTWVLTQAVCGRERAGTAAGIQNFGGNLGGALAPAITGVVAQATGSFGFAFVIAGAILVGGVAAYWWMIPSRPGEPR